MEKLPVHNAEDRAINAFQEKRINAELWGNDDNRRINVEFWYPRIENHINEIYIGLSDVRASDGILVSYDFERDGYVIKQSRTKEIDKGSYIDEEEHWDEVGFFQSWALEDKNEKL